MSQEKEIRTRINTWYEDWFAVDHLYSKWASRRGVTYNVLFTLYYLRLLEKVSPNMIASRMALSKQTVSSTLDSLEKKGYIVRTPDQTDGRACIASLTQAGQAFADQLLEPLFQLEKAAFAGLSTEEQDNLILLNHKIRNGLTQVMEEDVHK